MPSFQQYFHAQKREAPVKVSLVRPEHPGYREWCRQWRLRTLSTRPRDPFAQEYYAQLIGWEEAVRRLLGESVAAVAERILVSEGRPGNRPRTSYFELDFVSGSEVEPRLFVEIKLRQRSEGVATGWSQLRRSLATARTRWPDLRGICVCVAMGGILQTEEVSAVSTVQPPDLPRRLEAVTAADGEVLWLEGREVADFGIRSQIFTEDDVQQLAELRLDMLHPIRVLERRRRQASA